MYLKLILMFNTCTMYCFSTSNIVYNLHFLNGTCSKLISLIFCIILIATRVFPLISVFNNSTRFRSSHDSYTLFCFELLPMAFATIFCNLPGTGIGFISISCVLLNNLFFQKIVSYLSNETYMLFGVR